MPAPAGSAAPAFEGGTGRVCQHSPSPAQATRVCRCRAKPWPLPEEKNAAQGQGWGPGLCRRLPRTPEVPAEGMSRRPHCLEAAPPVTGRAARHRLQIQYP